MSAKYSADTIAEWFIAWAGAEDADLSNLKLQKLLYYAQGHYLAQTGEPLFRETMQAWSHGPVVPSVYRQYKSFGSGDVRPVHEFDWDQVDDETTQFLIQVWNTYGGYGAWKLRNMTHNERPWVEHFRPGEMFIEIPTEDVRSFFRSRLASNSA